MIRRLLVATVLWVSSALAGPPLTIIQDVLYKADGTRFNGTLTINWNSFTAPDNSTILTQSTTVRVIDGNLRVQLVPNTTSTSPATYVVTYNSDGRYQFQEAWSVPSSTVALHVRDVRTAMSTNGDTMGADTGDSSSGPIAESNVTGLIADLGARPLKGPGYSAGRAAVINATGLLESAVGSPTDCLHVDGSSGPCGNTVPSFVDGDSPTGIVDGSNTAFGLAAVPDPVSSLAVYRNGMLMKIGQDYTLTGTTLHFVAGAVPQAGDTLLAAYRLSGADSATGGPSFATPQVLCSGVGTTTGASSLAVLASCSIPAGLLAPGDRVEIRFDYTHTGSAAAFSSEIHWGATSVLHRDLPANETLLTGHVDATILPSASQIGTQTWGAAAAFAVSAQTATDAYTGGLSVTFLGSVAGGGDTLALNNFTVVRLP